MLLPSTTTWTFEAEEPLLLANGYAEEEGCALFHSPTSSWLALFPSEKIEVAHFMDAKGLLAPAPMGWLGFIRYEKSALFYRPTTLIKFDHTNNKATLYGKKVPLVKRLPKAKKLQLVERSDSVESYLAKIRSIKEWIWAGAVYQVALSHSFIYEGSCDPYTLFTECYHAGPVPYAAYIKTEEGAIISLSPELFLCKKGESLETRPIKGTVPRGLCPKEDASNKAYLQNSEKEGAELMMITDLMRNDLHRVCAMGSVHVKKMREIASYKRLFQQYSVIGGRVEKATILDVLGACFPGGSVTGCPKLAAIEKIRELEKRERGVYTGCVGFIEPNGDYSFNIAIRTLEYKVNRLYLQVGGAITIDSDPYLEYEETLAKATFFWKDR